MDNINKVSLCYSMRHLPPLAAVRVFEAAARHLHFTRAAAELGMTQAAVSYQIKLLEERLGAKLFVRDGRGLALTDLAKRISPQVTGAFDLLGDAFGSIRDEAASVLTISAPTSFGTNWLAGRLGAFQLSQPGLAVRLRVEDQIIDLMRGEADVAIRSGTPPWPGVRHQFVMRMAFAPFASPNVIARHAPIEDARDLLALPRIADEQWWTAWLGAVGLADCGDQPAGVYFDSQVLVGNAAINGQGVAMLTPGYWQAQIDSGQLVRLLPHVKAAHWQAGFWLVHPESKRNQPKIRAFRDWLMAEVRLAAGDDSDGILEPPGEATPTDGSA